MESDVTPLILEIKGNCLDDGPGIRTVVFFKGCPLDCAWCHNPESKKRWVEIAFDSAVCVGCDTCLSTCTRQALSRENPLFVDRRACDLCFECVETCPSGALERLGREMTVSGVVDRVIKDKPFFDTSRGGVTFSGGEPTISLPFLARAAESLQAKGVHVLVETCGHFNYAAFMEQVYPHVDLIYFDLKLMDPRRHAHYCGRPNDTILANFRKLYRQYLAGGVAVLPRVPLIPGITDTQENLSAILALFKEKQVRKAQLLAYHSLWLAKNRKLGVESSLGDDNRLKGRLAEARRQACARMFRAAGIALE